MSFLEGERFNCEKCGNDFDTFYEYIDHYDYTRVCEGCYNDLFQEAINTKNIDWFNANYDNPAKEFPKLRFLKED